MKKAFFLLKIKCDKTTIFHCKMTPYKNNNEITEMYGERGSAGLLGVPELYHKTNGSNILGFTAKTSINK